MEESIRKKINDYWSKSSVNKRQNQRLRWWQSPYIIEEINKKISGIPYEGFSQGLIERAKKLVGNKKFEHGISIGCGNGHKEMNLILQGLVSDFTLYELAESRIEDGQRLASKLGISQKVKFINGDAFMLETVQESYDFVHWNNALHHMMNVNEAVAWSHNILKEGGMFYMDDFVGPSRFQWSDKMLNIVEKVRTSLPDKYLQNPHISPPSFIKKITNFLSGKTNTAVLINPRITRPTIEEMINLDPSEAADSDRILTSIKQYFPDAELIITGGTIYHLALNDILYNFDETKDRYLLDLLMIIDDLCAQLGETHYATALAIKSSKST